MNHDSWRQIAEGADRAYALREQIQIVRESVELLRNTPEKTGEYELAWRLSRALFFLGQECPAETAAAAGALAPTPQSSRLHAEGANAGRRASRLEPARVEGHFWHGVNVALLAGIEHGPKAVVHALEAKRALRRAIRIDASYHAAGPLRVLARLQHKLPSFLGGSMARAYANFERAISTDPANTVTRIYFAELLLENDEASRARLEWEQVLNAPFDPDWAFEIKRDRRLAKEMLANVLNPEDLEQP